MLFNGYHKIIIFAVRNICLLGPFHKHIFKYPSDPRSTKTYSHVLQVISRVGTTDNVPERKISLVTTSLPSLLYKSEDARLLHASLHQTK